jgi:hypothetical protein
MVESIRLGKKRISAMEKFLRFCCVLIAIAVFSGCYTQLHTPAKSSISPSARWSPQSEREGQKHSDTFYVVIDTVYKDGDTLVDTTWYADPQSIPDSVAQNHTVHTLIIEPRAQEYCIWTRDFMGSPELRCFPSYAEYQFYLSSSTPWWIRDRMDYWPYYGYPPNFYFDPYSGYCRYGRNFNRIYFPRIGGREPFRQNDRDGIQRRNFRSHTPGDGRTRQGGNVVQPGSRSTTPSLSEPDRRGRGYQGQTKSTTPPTDATVAPPNNQGNVNEGRRTDEGGGNDGSSQPRKNPRSK